ncbi:chaplin family protein [Fodinicola feengrottensis]|uniref:chaplin family protein n=1 Tax=Fodinicola feengrottensis TaxID=435914 RepID=UPI0013D7B84C|nr:chaplin [Fodinicola feengrottensis]
MPITITDNAIGGDAFAGGHGAPHPLNQQTTAGHGTATGSTNGSHSVLGGNQVQAPVNAPVTICGNAIAVLGVAAAGCDVPGGSGGPTASGKTNGAGSIAGGNQVQAPVNAPVTVCGNSIAVLGLAASGWAAT